MEKTSVFNLIILDESGSMDSARKATISGCNEVINSAKSQAEINSDKEKAMISIYAFQDNHRVPSRYLCKNIPVGEARHITKEDYQPWGGTPLLDAVGSTLVDLEAVAATHDDAYGIVTIITDGYENASCHYTYAQVAAIIERLKEKGWTFNFIGANIDVAAEAQKLNIQNHMSFDSDAEGTENMFADYIAKETSFNLKRREAESRCSSKQEKINLRKRMAGSFFKLDNTLLN